MINRSIPFTTAPLIALTLCPHLWGQEGARQLSVSPPLESAPNPAAAKFNAGSIDSEPSSRDREKARQVAAKWSVEIDVQIVEITQDRALPLIPRLISGKPDQVEGACKQIDE